MDEVEDQEPVASAAESVLTLGVPPWMRTAPPLLSSDAMRPGFGTASHGSSAALHSESPGGTRSLGQSAEAAYVSDVSKWQMRWHKPVKFHNFVEQTTVSQGGPTVPGTSTMPAISTIPTKEEKENIEKARLMDRERVEEQSRADEEIDNSLRNLSNRLFLLGLFGLPLVHFLVVWYFYRELRDANANFFVRRNVFLALFFGIFQLVVGLAWVVCFQVMPERFEGLNILHANIKYDRLVS